MYSTNVSEHNQIIIQKASASIHIKLYKNAVSVQHGNTSLCTTSYTILSCTCKCMNHTTTNTCMFYNTVGEQLMKRQTACYSRRGLTLDREDRTFN